MTSTQRFRFWLIGLGVFVVLLYLLRSVLLPFVAGMAVAYFLDPLADRLERAGLTRAMATTVITAGFFVLVVLLVVLLAPVLQDQVVAFIHRVPDYLDSLSERLRPLVRDLQRKMAPGDIAKLRSSAGEYAGTAFSWLVAFVQRLLSGGLVVVNILSLLFITPVVTFYLLRDWDVMMGKVDGWLPREHADTIRAQAREINRTLSGFIRGQALVCLSLAVFYGLGLTLAGLDLGLVVGLVSGLISFVPYLGSITGFVVGMGLAMAQEPGWTLPGLVAGVFLAGQILEGQVLTPRLVGGKVGLHPVWIMFALLAGGALFGFLGILLAVPVAAVIGVLVRFALGRYLESPLYHGNHVA